MALGSIRHKCLGTMRIGHGCLHTFDTLRPTLEQPANIRQGLSTGISTQEQQFDINMNICSVFQSVRLLVLAKNLDFAQSQSLLSICTISYEPCSTTLRAVTRNMSSDFSQYPCKYPSPIHTQHPQ